MEWSTAGSGVENPRRTGGCAALKKPFQKRFKKNSKKFLKNFKKVLAICRRMLYSNQASGKQARQNEQMARWPVGQAVKTPPSHGGNRGSIPLLAVHQIADEKYTLPCRLHDTATDKIADGQLVKRLRRRPLTAETGVRFPYWLLRCPRTLCFRIFFYSIEKFLSSRIKNTSMCTCAQEKLRFSGNRLPDGKRARRGRAPRRILF